MGTATGDDKRPAGQPVEVRMSGSVDLANTYLSSLEQSNL